MTRVRGFAPWRPQAKTVELLDQVATVLDTYSEHLPLTARQVYYRLVGTVRYDKTEAGYNRLTEVLNRARRAGLVDFDAIRDDGVRVEDPQGFTGMADYWANVAAWAGQYRRDRLAGQEVAVEVWVEAAGMVPQVVRVVADYGVAVYSSGGFDSTTAKHDAAQRVAGRHRPTVVLHIGDHDPSGVAVFTSAAEDVAAMAAGLGRRAAVRFERVAVTAEQVTAYGLPEAPAKASDHRGEWIGGTVQAEALDPATLADIVRTAVTELIDADILDEVIAVEEAERAELVATVEELGR